MKTRQELFDAAFQHIMAQGKPAFDAEVDNCYYYDDVTGLRCAIGGVLPLETAKALGGEAINAGDLPRYADQYGAVLPEWFDDELNEGSFLDTLQSAHDRAARVTDYDEDFLKKYKENMRDVAEAFELNMPKEA